MIIVARRSLPKRIGRIISEKLAAVERHLIPLAIVTLLDGLRVLLSDMF
jgi:hypothetical protein